MTTSDERCKSERETKKKSLSVLQPKHTVKFLDDIAMVHKAATVVQKTKKKSKNIFQLDLIISSYKFWKFLKVESENFPLLGNKNN